MRIVVDANVIVAALVRPDGWTAQQLAREDVEWIAPAFLLDELAKHAKEHATKAKCTPREWERRVARLAKRIELVPDEAFVHPETELIAAVARVDPDDVPYAVAFVVARAELIWTRDRAILHALPGVAVSVVPSLE